MKKTVIVYAIALMALGSCKKETVKVEPRAEPQASTQNSEITVVNGRLKFPSIAKFYEILDMNKTQRKKILETIQNLPGFTSKSEMAKSQTSERSSSACDCVIDDNFINEIVDANNMVDMGDWTIKLDACDPLKKTYAFYRPKYTAGDVTLRENALISCNYDPNFHFNVYSYDTDVLEELQIYADSLHGNHDAGLNRCHDVVCGDRDFRVESVVGWFDGPTLSANGMTQQPETPLLKLKYRKGWISHGRTTASFELNYGLPTTVNSYVFEFDQTHYAERCGPIMDSQVGFQFGTLTSIVDWEFEEYFGRRLKAGWGSVKVRARFNTPNMLFYSPYAEILF